MNILVIGNGFDLAHGLPTKYSDFLYYVKALKNYKSSMQADQSGFFKYFQSLNDTKTKIFDELNDLIKDNIWLEYFISVFERRINEGKGGWIDFESEISTVIQNFDNMRLRLDGVKIPTRQIRNIMQIKNSIFESYFTPEKYPYIKQKMINDLSRLSRCLEIYLCDYLSIDQCSPLLDISNLKIDKVLSFNYTNSYKQIYDKAPNSKIEYDFIHGMADINNDINSCNLVLGIDEYLSGDAMNKDNEFIQFKKFYQRIYKGTGCKYSDWLDSWHLLVNRTPLKIYIYGHSLDVTDADILKKLITTEGAKTTIFYHSKESMGKHISNLVKIIGEEELIKRTDGKNRTIIFKQSS